MKIMISAGEASGDLHGASIARSLKKLAPDIELFGMGGSAMQQAGVRIEQDIEGLNIMGIVEVLKNLSMFFALRDRLVELMERERPELLVTIDYPDFNMRLAKKAKQSGIPILSYIPPSAWAWRKGRAKTVAGIVDKVAAIFPFEADTYQKAGADVSFVGHPLVDIVKPSLGSAEAREFFRVADDERVILLLPGSRHQEIAKLLPVMLASAEKLAEQRKYRFFLPAASTISREILQQEIAKYKVQVEITTEKTYDLMNIAETAIASSGTVTLEAAILGLPSVVIYKMAALTYLIGKLLVDIPNISLPNIVASERVIPELLQGEVTVDNIVREVSALDKNCANGKRVRDKLARTSELLGGPGAVDRVAELILKTAKEKKQEEKQ